MKEQFAAPVQEERPVGTPGAGEVLVKVNATSMNYHDTVNLQGLIWGPWPRVPMTDGAGEVVAVGPGVTDLAVGDRVTSVFYAGWYEGTPTPEKKAEMPGDSCDGWLQQYRVASAQSVVTTPAHLSDLEAATLPCAAVTAWGALIEGNVGEGDVVVTQGTGGVSLFAVQLAHALGATVILTSSSDEKLEIGQQLGATHLINYRTNPDWESAVREITGGRGADLVVDIGGPETLAHSVRAVRMAGTVAVVGVLTGYEMAPIPITDTMLNNIRIVGITVASAVDFVKMNALVSKHKIKPHISDVFDWTEVTKAAEFMQSAGHIGKIALTIP
ncbi:hypothetical protein AU194_20885 [Mycobacterium sp. GA-2829]|nr:hypothetical protein AU194_20885 [Mycobacterium sp. GA-2829]